ncbi:STAS domain-containing protein [Actinokineospora spheciospongiae]|nr:STAS domain-containing protein [Actinokineospora spheciospongiae]
MASSTGELQVNDCLLDTTVARTAGWTTVQVKGEVDLLTAPALRAAVSDGLTRLPSPAVVVVDLTGVTFLGCTGIGVLVDAGLRARERGGAMVVSCPGGTASRRIFTLLGLDGVLTLIENLDDLDGVI